MTSEGVRSKLYWGEVGHIRFSPKEHSFSYPIFTFGVDIDELSSLSIAPRLFAVNKSAVFSVCESDYFPGTGGLRHKVEECLRAAGVSNPPARMMLLTMPRYFGYVFNPVSFVVCRDESNRILALVTQVNNTFGDTHLYPLVCEPSESSYRWDFPKEFFVSPFFAVEGDYSLTLEEFGDRLSIRVDLNKDGALLFSGTLRGEGEALTQGRIWATIRRYPITSLLTMPRIHGQAIKLYARAGAKVQNYPEPSSPYTFRSYKNLFHHARLGLLSLLKGRG